MKKFVIQPAGDAIKVTASTKAGLISAAVQGMFEAAGPKWVQEDPVKDHNFERPFSVTAENFPKLLLAILNSALAAAAANKESYEDVAFSLITDIKAEGHFVGRAVKGFKSEIKSAQSNAEKIEKNVVLQWETNVNFEM
jgi:hypothetical protein